MIRKLGFCGVLLLSTFSMGLQGQTAASQEKKEDFTAPNALKEESSVTSHRVTIGGDEVHYKAIAGNLLLRNDQHLPKASIFYVAYFKDDVKDLSDRPIIFCFNGGPGSSSVWLHMGILGPKRVELTEEGAVIPPYQVVNNEYSLLDMADLVFIDPVSTGYSRAAPGEDAKQFHGVDEDIQSIGEFIRQFITFYERWDSPKFLAGESYGTTRAAGLAEHLHDEQNIYLNGIILISSVLNFQTAFDYDNGNDLPYPLYLPTYAATAWYHKKLNPDLQKDFNKTLEEAKQFAVTDYTLALMKGDGISKEEKAKIVQKLSLYTGLKPEFIERSNLRINPSRFSMELLRDKNLTVGRFDSRIVGNPLDTSCDYPSYDPSFNDVIGVFTAAFNQYVRKDLQVKNEIEYKILADINGNWNFSKVASNQFLNMSSKLHDVMLKNEKLRVFVGSGYYDLALPYFATDYTFSHLRLPANLYGNIQKYYYPAGHMMYTQKESLIKLRNDLAEWMKNSKKN
jgi:carboxypeptidase C (cathepsin A)